MDYKTAKALNDSGFHVKPLQEFSFKYHKNDKIRSSGCINVICEHGMKCNVENCEYVDVPTLEDLMEANGVSVSDYEAELVKLWFLNNTEAPIDRI